MASDEASKTVDVLRYGKEGNESSKYVTVPSDEGMKVVAAHREEASKRRLVRTVFTGVGALVGGGIATLYSTIGAGILVAVVILVIGGAQEYLRGYPVPELVDTSVRREEANEEYEVYTHVEEPFEEEIND